MKQNPLLTPALFPLYSKIKAEHINPAISNLIESSKNQIDHLIKSDQKPTWDNFVAPLEEIDNQLSYVWNQINHLNAVQNTPEFQEAYDQALEQITNYQSEYGQNIHLFSLFNKVYEDKEFLSLNIAQQKVITNALRDFRLSGVNLDIKEKEIFKNLNRELSELESKFEQNILKATNDFNLIIKDVKDLEGLATHTINHAKKLAIEKKEEGYLLDLHFPTYFAVMSLAKNRSLRELFYKAYVTKASSQEANNGPILEQIINLRQKSSKLLGFNNYAEYSLATKMNKDPKKVIEFLNKLVKPSKLRAEEEIQILANFAKKKDNIDKLQAWDITYYSELLSHEEFNISQEALRPFFPLTKVLKGLFEIANKLFGITVIEENIVDTWNPEVKFFTVQENNQPIGFFYLDLYARPHKRGGAWMSECKNRSINMKGDTELPVAHIVTNFTPPAEGKLSLLTHDEVQTLFHEFGHAIHHLLSVINYPSITGIHGVAWDAVELPSQLMENWTWEEDAIPFISEHNETKECLPISQLLALKRTKKFQAGLQMVRQLEFSLFDLLLHMEDKPQTELSIQSLLDKVRKEVSVMIPPSFNRFQNSFSHIFAGGYSAGYFSYKWAEVLSSDVFDKFLNDGIFNSETGYAFRQQFLELGGSVDALELFKNFRGREPNIEALLEQSGIT
ncbi:MAG: oligopeptidase [Francisellaceae bacterium]|nr:oligopeptidase [Francisellaceae bacterium]